MIKALMIITMVSGGEYTANLPTMEQCMKEITPVESQKDVRSASCIPRTEDRVPTEILAQFMDTFMMLNERDPCGDYFPPNEGSFVDKLMREDDHKRGPNS